MLRGTTRSTVVVSMHIPIARAPVIACKHCAATTRLDRERARAAGWRMYHGPSITGKLLDDVICPACTGEKKPEEVGVTWLVRCNTCDWATGDEPEEPITSYHVARQQASYHDCEPEIELRPPGHEEWYGEFDFDCNGKLSAVSS